MEDSVRYPEVTVKLIGTDGNAFLDFRWNDHPVQASLPGGATKLAAEGDARQCPICYEWVYVAGAKADFGVADTLVRAYLHTVARHPGGRGLVGMGGGHKPCAG